MSEVVIDIDYAGQVYTYRDASIVEGEVSRAERIGEDGRLERPGLTLDVDAVAMIGLAYVDRSHLSRPRCRVTHGGSVAIDGVLARVAASRTFADGTRTWTLTVEDDATERLVGALDMTGLDALSLSSSVQCLTQFATYDEDADPQWSSTRATVSWYRLRTLLLAAVQASAGAHGAAVTASVGDLFAYRIPYDDEGEQRTRLVSDPAVAIRHVYADPSTRRLPDWTAAELLDLVETMTGCLTVATYHAWPSMGIDAAITPGAWTEPDDLPADLEPIAEDYDADPVSAADVAMSFAGEPTEQPHSSLVMQYTAGVEAQYGALRYDLRPRWDADERRTAQEPGNATTETLPLWHPQWVDPADESDADGDYAGRIYRGVPVLLSGEDRTYVATIDAGRGIRHRQPDDEVAVYAGYRWEAAHAATRVAERGLRGIDTLVVTTQLAREDVASDLRAGDYAYSVDGRSLVAVSVERALDEGVVSLELACPLSQSYAVRPPRIAPRIDALIVTIPGEEPLPQDSFEARVFVRRTPADLPADVTEIEVSTDGGATWTASSGREVVISQNDHVTFRARSVWFDGVTSGWSIASTDPAA